MQNFGVTNKEHYGMLWYFLEWSIVSDARQPEVRPFAFKYALALPKLYCSVSSFKNKNSYRDDLPNI